MRRLEPLMRCSSLASMPSMARAYIFNGMSSLRPPCAYTPQCRARAARHNG
jgi:hypothetical protein